MIDFVILIELLSAVPTTEVPTTAAICEDISTKCEIYKAFCGNHAFVTKRCHKTCGICSKEI